MNAQTLKPMVEAVLMAAESPVPLERLVKMFDDENDKPSKEDVLGVVSDLQSDYAGHGVELVEVASGYRFRARAEYGEHITRLSEERRPRYSRALLETLAIIAYRQPITRGEIEHIRGVAVSTGIMRTLLEREWVRVAGHRDVPGRPAVYSTTQQFLDYFGMKSLEELPSLAELKDIDDINADLFAELEAEAAAAAAGAAGAVEGEEADEVAVREDAGALPGQTAGNAEPAEEDDADADGLPAPVADADDADGTGLAAAGPDEMPATPIEAAPPSVDSR